MGTSLALVGSPSVAMSRVEPRSMPEVFELAQQLAKARGFVPDVYLNNPAAIAACILTGLELGLGAMQSLRDVYIVKGRPSLSAALMLSLARRAGVRTTWVKTTPEYAEIAITVPGEKEQRFTFTKQDAITAGLWSGDTWKKYPAIMLRARCVSGAIRAACPDVLGGGGVYESTSGELTDGEPGLIGTRDIIDAETVEASAAPPPAPSKRMQDCATADALHYWCTYTSPGKSTTWGELAVQGGMLAKLEKHAASLNVGLDALHAWLGVEPQGATDGPDYDAGEQDAPPPDDR
jgi:hypothetical protein